MSIIHNYKKAQFAQINLDDGNKILVSYGATDMRVFRLGFLSMPKETIHIFKSQFLVNLNNKIGYDLSKEVVKILSTELVKAASLEEAKKICLELEEDQSFLDRI
ncbi:MAG: hypothetical protein AAB891_01200 [Patescibacteria group bacterium]